MANFEKYGWNTSAEKDAELADEYYKNFEAAVSLSLSSIAKALIEIRDELRKEEHHGEN